MKPLKKRIRKYMLQVTVTLMVVVLLVVMCLQVFMERRREYEKSMSVLTQIRQFIVANIISEEVTDTTEQRQYTNLFSMIRVNSDADYYVVSDRGIVLGTTVNATLGSSCEDVGLSLDKVKTDSNGFYEKINGNTFFVCF